MKKILLLFMCATLGLSLFACGKENKKVSIITPNGTPFIAIGGLIGDKDVEIENVDGADALTTALTTKTHDIVIAPLTLGAKTYIKGVSKYKLDATITTNNTYIISKKDVALDSLTDLNGKKLIAYGQNNTPDIALSLALSKENVNPNITYEQSVTNAMGQFLGNNGSSEYDYCLIAEPQLTQLKTKNKLELNVLDLSKYLNQTIYQAGLFVNPDSYNKSVEKVINKIKNNVAMLNEKPVEYANDIVSKNRVFEALTANIIGESIPKANIKFNKAKDNKDSILAYYKVVTDYNKNILGGDVNEGFFN